ncbi:hypothetical protein LPJ81_007095, partial [Coemansia sp. IMI 209127]
RGEMVDSHRYRNPGTWDHQATASQQSTRPEHLLVGWADLDFARETLKRKFVTTQFDRAMRRATMLVVHTDSSLIKDEDEGKLSMSFAAILEIQKEEPVPAAAQRTGCPPTEQIIMAGRTMDGVLLVYPWRARGYCSSDGSGSARNAY